MAMKYAPYFFLAFVALLISTSPAQAEMCGRPAQFSLGLCSKEHCSKLFSSDFKLRHGCRYERIEKKQNPAAIDAMLRQSENLDDREQLVIFEYRDQCHWPYSTHIEQSFAPPNNGVYYKSPDNRLCEISQMRSILVETHTPENAALLKKVSPKIDFRNKDFDEIKAQLQDQMKKIKRSINLFYLKCYAINIFLMLLVGVLIRYMAKEFMASKRTAAGKMMALLPVVFVHFVCIAIVGGTQNPGSYIMLFTLALYPWLVITLIRKRRKESHEPV